MVKIFVNIPWSDCVRVLQRILTFAVILDHSHYCDQIYPIFYDMCVEMTCSKLDSETPRIRIRFLMVSTGLPRPCIADGWCWKTFRHHPNQHQIWFWMVSEGLPAMYGLGRSAETIQNLILKHKLIRIHSVFLHTFEKDMIPLKI